MSTIYKKFMDSEPTIGIMNNLALDTMAAPLPWIAYATDDDIPINTYTRF